jgi:CTP-dependent riboflavin kinase
MAQRAFEARWSAIKRVLEDAGVTHGATVLDVGTSGGKFARAAADELGCQVLGIDAKDRLWKPHPGVEWRIDNLKPRKIRRLERFDAILALSVLHHTRYWRESLVELRLKTRHVLIVEVPNAAEDLKIADVARAGQLEELAAEVDRVGYAVIARTGATRQVEIQRKLVVVPPLMRGQIVGGGGHHAANSARLADAFTEQLGWTPYPGSLNLRVGHGTDLRTRPDAVVPSDRSDRVYRMWHAQMPLLPDIPVVVMACRREAQGRSIEVLSPVRLREHLDPDAVHDIEILPPIRL